VMNLEADSQVTSEAFGCGQTATKINNNWTTEDQN
jgi:hypothetical protein